MHYQQPGTARSRTARHVGVLLAVVVVGFLAGCASNKGDSVAVLGDSITTLDQADLQSQLGGDYRLTISGNFGRTVEQVVPEAKVVSSRNHDQVIINLGTNDVIGDLPIDTSMATLAEEIAMFDSAKCIHLVNINEHMVDLRDGASLTKQAEAFNAALQDLAHRENRVSIIDWNSVAKDTLNDKSPPTSTLTKDSIHPTAEGNKKLNELYAEALGGCGALL